MIRPNNRLFWLILAFLVLVLVPLIFRPVRQVVGALVWDSVIVPLYARSALLVAGHTVLAALFILVLLLLPLLLSPIWEMFGVLDGFAMSLARWYYKRLARYGLNRDKRQDRDPYARFRDLNLKIGYWLRLMKRIPLLSDVHAFFFNDKPSPRVALFLINRVHEASYMIAAGKNEEPDKIRQRWDVAVVALQALAAHTLAGSDAVTARLIGALLLDDLHSQSLVFAARYQIPIPERLPVWRQDALALYRALNAVLSNESPWAVWVMLRMVWLEAFSPDADAVFDWSRRSPVEDQFWRLTEFADDEQGIGIAIAAAHRLTMDLVALTRLGSSPGLADQLRFAADLGYWLDSTADSLRATAWHTAPSSRASELPPGTFLAGQLIDEIAPKWSPPGSPASDAIRAQMIAARAAIYELIRGGWNQMVPEPAFEQAQAFARRAAEEIEIENELGGGHS